MRMEMGFSALLSPQNTEQSKCNQINVLFLTIQNMNMKGFLPRFGRSVHRP